MVRKYFKIQKIVFKRFAIQIVFPEMESIRGSFDIS